MRKTFRTTVVSFAAMLVWGASVSDGAQQQQPVLVVQGGTLIDGNGGAPVPNSVVVVTGNRITAVGRQGQVQVPAGAQVINAAGKWVLPGFVDAKANWYWQYGEAFIHYGVTTAFVSGGRNNLGLATRDAINHGIFEGPRLYQSVVNIGGPGPMLQRPDNYEPGNGDRIPHSSAEAVEMVRAIHAAGGDIITFSNGDGPPEIYDAAVKEALRLGMGIDFRAMGPQTRALQACAMGGPIVYVHTGNVGAQIARDEAKWATYIGLPPDPFSEMDEAKANAAIQKLVACNAYLEPDLMAADRGFSKNWKRVQEETYEVFKDPNLLAYYPQHSILDLHDHLLGPETYLNAEQIRVRSAGFANHARFLKRYVDAGGKIVAASDITQTPPGLGIHQEMAVFVEDVGLTPMQAIQAGTKWVAEGFRKPDIGSIEVGKLADIVVLTRDPLQNILNTRSVETVIKDGKVMDRAYDPAWRGGMFSFSADEDTYDMIPGAAWAASLKQATAGRGGGNANAAPPPAQNPVASPTPGIEATAPHTILRGSPDTPITVTGFNFVQRSQAYYDGIPVPTRVVNRNQLVATIPNNLLGRAGAFKLVVKNPAPLATPDWGSESNYANILVPFEFTKILPQPQW
jgi:imidazolonepropionase-like amidohydrolase